MIVKMSEKLLLRHRSMLFAAILLITGLTLGAPYACSQPVITSFTANGSSGTVTTAVGNTVTFECVADDSAIGYNWDFDGNGIADRVTVKNSVRHIYTETGTFYTTCNAGDAAGKFKISNVIKITVFLLDIKANGTDGPVTPIDNLSVTVALDPGSSSGDNADWWVSANVSGTSTIDGWYYFNIDTFGFVPVGASPNDLLATHQGDLFSLTTFQVLNVPVSGLPSGTYRFYFAVDTNMNGVLDLGELFSDSVDVTVTP